MTKVSSFAVTIDYQSCKTQFELKSLNRLWQPAAGKGRNAAALPEAGTASASFRNRSAATTFWRAGPCTLCAALLPQASEQGTGNTYLIVRDSDIRSKNCGYAGVMMISICSQWAEVATTIILSMSGLLLVAGCGRGPLGPGSGTLVRFY